MKTEDDPTVRRATEIFRNKNRNAVGSREQIGSNRRGLYHAYLELKNRRQQREIRREDGYTVRGAVGGLVKVGLDWVIDIVIATLFFVQGRYYVAAASLFFVFFGGAIVTFCLNVLIKRKGDQEFKKEIEETSPVLLKLMYIPSFLPFFSAGVNVHLTSKYQKAKDEEERKDLRRGLKICEEHVVTDALFECTFEAIPQAILQLIILLEKPEFTRWIEFIPLVGVTSAWLGISMVPIQMAKCLNNIEVRVPEVIAGLGNKAVTLLSFVFFIAASRKYFAEPNEVTWTLVAATLISLITMAVFSELPGLFSFRVDVRDESGMRAQKVVEIISHIIWVVIPVASFCFWGLTLYHRDEIHQTRFYLASAVFLLSFGISFCGCLFERKLPWLGQFSTDVILLLYMSLVSYFRGTEFQDIDFQFEPQQVNVEEDGLNNNNNNGESAKAVA